MFLIKNFKKLVGAVGLEPTTALRTLLIKSEKLHQLSYAPEIKPTCQRTTYRTSRGIRTPNQYYYPTKDWVGTSWSRL